MFFFVCGLWDFQWDLWTLFGINLEWKLYEPKEKHYPVLRAGSSGLKVGIFKGKRSWTWRICVARVDSNVVFVKGEENLWILFRKSVETCRTTKKIQPKTE